MRIFAEAPCSVDKFFNWALTGADSLVGQSFRGRSSYEPWF